MDPDGLKLWLYFITVWILFWGSAGGVVCHKLGRPAWKGVVFGAILAPVGILLALVTHDERSASTHPGGPLPTEKKESGR